MAAAKRIVPGRSCGALIDVQSFFLSQVDNRHRSRLRTNAVSFLRLLDHFRIPVVATLERPVDQKGALPEEITAHLGERACVFEKSFFDLCREQEIERYLAGTDLGEGREQPKEESAPLPEGEHEKKERIHSRKISLDKTIRCIGWMCCGK